MSNKNEKDDYLQALHEIMEATKGPHCKAARMARRIAREVLAKWTKQ